MEHFDEDRICVFNFMSAPGAGKTTLLIEIVQALKDKRTCAVIEGDMVGDLDTKRMKEAGIEAFQISTGKACHLDASMVARLLHEQDFAKNDLLFLENVGNLVCPAEFALGEHYKVVLLSVCEGDDKPFKYPVIFQKCDAVILTKCDLLPHFDFNLKRAHDFIKELNPKASIFTVATGSRKMGSTSNQLPDLVKWIIERSESSLK